MNDENSFPRCDPAFIFIRGKTKDEDAASEIHFL